MWRRDGTWERIHQVLRERLRVRLGRHPPPSAGIIDSQSVKTTGVGGVRGYDGGQQGKQVKGRKRHLLVDTEGLVLAVSVRPAHIMDRDGVKLLLADPVPARFARLAHVWLDVGYNGRGTGEGGQGVDRADARLARRDRQTPPALQEGLDPRRPSRRPDRLVPVSPTAGVPCAAAPVGGGENPLTVPTIRS